MDLDLYFRIIFFIFGAVMGSFFHVVATRLAKKESLLSPPSHCPNCNHRLKWQRNLQAEFLILYKSIIELKRR